jgi:myo-inositol 2-dehydrogenase/D-chiro-inositol 1-dehydrogenase
MEILHQPQPSTIEHAEVSLALIGAGRMGLVHASALSHHLPRARLASVAEPRAEAVAALGALADGAHIYDSAAEALAHPGLDGCVIVTPTDTHLSVVTAALERGLNVFCEKPLTLDPDQSRSLAELAGARDRLLQVGFWRRFYTPIVKAKELIAGGAIGAPLFCRLSQWDVDCPPVEWCAPERSGGIFVDMAVHEFDQVEWFLGDEIVSVEAKALPRVIAELARVDDYDNAVVWFTTTSGAQGMIDLSRNGRYADDVRVEVSFLGAVAQELAAFTLAIGGSREVALPGPAASIRATELGHAARRSARTGRAESTDPEG